ncbi:hypothetical protein [Psychrobacter pygoscelis]|uniref:hypothetical protein n=1 Tax=Psychrobacter pygoscelis TaxID=2488563 RepID=UPI00103ACDEB|nr:hypothetical protein [Psychrobacter pygoscelis]
MKPLFCPLKKEYFLQFKNNEKTVEYRAYGKQWNEKTCTIGRLMNLSLGYNGERILAVITNFTVININQAPQAAIDIYKHKTNQIACIGVSLDTDKNMS